ncbi:2-hydroxychromene-2-carboxylate isomerase [Variovorax paradoxus]|uniref:2-hydroxychromene-2-carboxylate isomerase n=1 Tax=Variovorax paradoxus TaxID=34073 RepID=A0A6I6HN79_VARPD|nr:2-hydroxychromene-2-carboxylate isomerase [Variovorax paradoxus]QGW84285.1 2-hydroxychromene-2-carboxylate isomerase [Variovorax paradoxus]
MKHIDFYLDFISPYAHLAFEHLPEALEGLSYSVAYKPVLLGALLKHHGQLGPAEIPAKRAWTYRHVLWLGHANGIHIEMPASHPYNPLPHLRLAVSTSDDGRISRLAAETIFRNVWRGGEEAGDAARLAALAAQLQLKRDMNSDESKALLKRNTDEAVQAGVFGTPAYVVDGRQFWGFDGLAMLRAYMGGDTWFDGPHWAGADQRPSMLRSSKN